jgi:hypothetical protein
VNSGLRAAWPVPLQFGRTAPFANRLRLSIDGERLGGAGTAFRRWVNDRKARRACGLDVGRRHRCRQSAATYILRS